MAVRIQVDDEEEVKGDMTPMIDIIFLLLIFFILTTKFIPEEKMIASVLPTNKGQASASVQLEEKHDVNILIFPAAFFMGGTIPAMAQVAVGERSRFGRVSAWLYGINTLGATLGVVAGAFLLLPSFGLRISYAIALLCSLLVAAWAWKGAKAEVKF